MTMPRATQSGSELKSSRTTGHQDGERLIEQQARRTAQQAGVPEVRVRMSFKLTLRVVPQSYTLVLSAFGHTQEAVFTAAAVEAYVDAQRRERVDAIVTEAILRLVDAVQSDHPDVVPRPD